MALQYSVAVRNAQLDAVESTIGASAVLKLYDLAAGAPANCAAAITATVVATITLGADWMDAASSGSKAKSAGAWQDASADNAGTIDFWRLFATDGTTCGAQGTASLAAGGGDMILDNTAVTAGQSITISTFTISAGNA